ncbi:MAG: DUF222 domain-containing protein [Actinomycetia bacterium]|nr:DUF222 domain-containing protein [Actinomycetes bacterium]
MIVDVDQLAAETAAAEGLVQLGHRISRDHYDLCVDSARFADGPVWIAQGAPSAAHWLADRLHIAASTVREWIRIGRALSAFRPSANAFAGGRLSYAKVQVLTRYLTAENEAELLTLAKRIPAASLPEAIAAWTMANEPGEVVDARHHRDRSVRIRNHADGTRTTTIRSNGTVGGTLQAAIDAELMRGALRREPDGNWPSIAQQRHDALARIIDGTGGSQQGNIGCEVVFHVRGDGCALDDGTPVTESAVARLLDRAFIRLLIHGADGKAVNASTRRRLPNKQQKRLVKERDRACIDCGRKELLTYDHNPAWEQTRRTHTDELELRCVPCHRKRHHEDETA